MKKLFSQAKYKKYNQKRARRSQKLNLGFQRFKKAENLKQNRIKKSRNIDYYGFSRSEYIPYQSFDYPIPELHREYFRVYAPNDFRLLVNPEGVIEFIFN